MFELSSYWNAVCYGRQKGTEEGEQAGEEGSREGQSQEDQEVGVRSQK